MTKEKRDKVWQELRELVNRNSLENDSNTPDFILADILLSFLENYNIAKTKLDKFYSGGKVPVKHKTTRIS